MAEQVIQQVVTQALRVEDLAVAALDRSEDHPVMQTLLTEIREKAATIHGLLLHEEVHQ
jgi:hypothetical protein